MTHPATRSAQDTSPEHPLGFAIVGAGMVAQYHAQAIAQTPGARLVATCRADATRTAEVEARFGVPCETDYAALLARSDVDAVCICTPSGLHAEQTLAAAQAGKHILVEKPMALTLAEADAMIHTCHQAGVLLGVALQRRTDPAFATAQAAIARGALGRMILGCVAVPYVRTQAYYESAAWRGTWKLDGGGALMNQGIHLLDLLLWYLGDVAEVQAQMATLAHAIEVEDCISATLRFKNGALGSVVATTAAFPGYAHRVEVYGEDGGMQIEGEQIARWESASMPHLPGAALAASKSVTANAGASARAAGESAEAQPQPAPAAGAGSSPRGIGPEGHQRLIADLVAAIRDHRQPAVPGEEGRRSLALALAIYEAARSGRRITLAASSDTSEQTHETRF